RRRYRRDLRITPQRDRYQSLMGDLLERLKADVPRLIYSDQGVDVVEIGQPDGRSRAAIRTTPAGRQASEAEAEIVAPLGVRAYTPEVGSFRAELVATAVFGDTVAEPRLRWT